MKADTDCSHGDTEYTKQRQWMITILCREVCRLSSARAEFTVQLMCAMGMRWRRWLHAAAEIKATALASDPGVHGRSGELPKPPR